MNTNDLFSSTRPIVTYDSEEAWIEARRNGIGASEAATVLGENPFGDPLALYCHKLGIVPGDDLSANEAVEWGKRLEPAVADKYESETGRALFDLGRFTSAYNHAFPWAFATLDRIVIPCNGDCHAGEPGVLEIKTTSARNEGLWENGVPRLPWIQIQHQLAVTGFAWGTAAVLIGGQKFRWMDVDRDDIFIGKMMEAENAFWCRVTAHDPPDPNSGDASRSALAALYPRPTLASVALPGVAMEWDERLEQVKAALRSLDTEKTGLENLIKAAIGEAEAGIMANGVSYSWKEQTRAEHIVKASSFRVLRRINPKA